MRYIIMADGKGTRWGNFTDRPKHLIEIDGETLLERLVRQLRTFDDVCDITITARDPRYEVAGVTRYVPKNNRDEIDRFTVELIEDHVCFLYGDTCYTDEAVANITRTEGSGLLFFGDDRRIIAVKVFDGDRMKQHIDRVKQHNPDGKGWHVYQSYSGLELHQLGDGFVFTRDGTQDFNTPEDYLTFIKK